MATSSRTLIEQSQEGLKLKIFCKDPSRFLGRIFDSAHATIALSATLEPFDFYRKTLGFPDSRTTELSLPSPFPRENRKIVVVADVDTTCKQRANHYDRIAETVAEHRGGERRQLPGALPELRVPARGVRARMPPLRRT